MHLKLWVHSSHNMNRSSTVCQITFNIVEIWPNSLLIGDYGGVLIGGEINIHKEITQPEKGIERGSKREDLCDQ